MATMKDLKSSNTIQGLIIAATMQEYKNSRDACMNECMIKMMGGATINDLGPLIDAEESKAKAKVIKAVRDSMVIVRANLNEAREFEVPDTEFIENCEFALKKAEEMEQLAQG
jgi:hypothetical protein